MSWDRKSAPNAAYTEVLGILNNCPEHDGGIPFADLADIQPDPHYGMRIVYDEQEESRGLYVAALVACASQSKTESIGDDGYTVVTVDVKDIAHHDGTVEFPIGSYTLVGFRSMENEVRRDEHDTGKKESTGSTYCNVCVRLCVCDPPRLVLTQGFSSQ